MRSAKSSARRSDIIKVSPLLITREGDATTVAPAKLCGQATIGSLARERSNQSDQLPS